ncbi:hypothetical protein [Sphingomonas sp. LR55]
MSANGNNAALRIKNSLAPVGSRPIAEISRVSRRPSVWSTCSVAMAATAD